MKRLLAVVLMLAVSFACLPALAGSGFSSDTAAINEAAKSVLLLEIYNSRKNLIATGSGFVAFDDSTLVTNYHVIDGGHYITAYGDDGKAYSVTKVLCADKENDVAILGFDKATGLKPLTLKAYSNLMRGEVIVAIGSPEGYLNTVSTGIISSLPEENEIQFTAPVSHGSSGGALLNDYGEVIGITTKGVMNAQNINIAVNIAIAKAMYKAWDKKTQTLSRHGSTAKMDFTGVYEVQNHSYEVATDSVTEWACPNCGTRNSSKFCTECGTEKPAWVCKCGTKNSGKFCGSCGTGIADLVAEANTAIGYEKSGNFENAITAYKNLSSFNSISFSTNDGKNWVAQEHVNAAYYAWAEKCLNQRDFKSAVAHFQSAGNYLDAANRVYSVYYAQGEYQYSQGRYDDAIKSFGWADKYSDASTRILMCYYSKGEALLQNGQYDEAVTAFKSAGKYNNAANMVLKSRYEQGCACIKNGEYDAAITAFKAAGKYEDAATMILYVYYIQAEAEMKAGNYKQAEKLFKQAGDYSDAVEQAKRAADIPLQEKYDEAMKLMEDGRYKLAAEKFNNLGEYKDAKNKEKSCYYMLADSYMEENKYDAAYTYYNKAEDFADAKEKGIASRVEKAKSQYNQGKYDDARATLTNFQKNPEAKDIYMLATYKSAEYYGKLALYSTAIKHYEECIDYADSREKLYETKTLYLHQMIDKGLYDGAYKLYAEEEKTEYPLEDPAVVQLGSKGKTARRILEMANKMGFIGWISDTQEEYNNQYTNGIKKMEANFGLDADGTITLTEYIVLNNVFYPGVSGKNVSLILERISDLGYLDAFGKLPDDHSVYESRYSYSIKNIEKALGLKADGFLTADEREIINKQKVEAVEKIATLNVNAYNGTVTLSWSQCKGAKWYEVYRNSKLIATITGTYYSDKEAKQGRSNVYYIKACKYSKSSRTSKSIYVDPVYKWYSVKDLSKDQSNLKKYITIQNLVTVSQKWDGKDLWVRCYANISGQKYYVVLIFANHDTWDWKGGTTASKLKAGSVISSCKGQIIEYEKSIKKPVTLYVPHIELQSVTWNY